MHQFLHPHLASQADTKVPINKVKSQHEFFSDWRNTNLGLEKHFGTQNLRKWDSSQDSTNAKIPHLHIHKPKQCKVGTALVIFV